MEKSEFLVESPPPPRRKVRRTPITARERGVDVACRNGQFVMPKEAFQNTPLVIGICQLSIQVYNLTADYKMAKTSCEAAMVGSQGPLRCAMERVCSYLKKRINLLRTAGSTHRQYILDVEEGKPVNEPLSWSRD